MLVILSVATALRFIVIGGDIYEILLVDRACPDRFDLIQLSRGGISRMRFWILTHLSFELGLSLCLVLYRPFPDVRNWRIAAFASHVIMRGWSALRFTPLAIRF